MRLAAIALVTIVPAVVPAIAQAQAVTPAVELAVVKPFSKNWRCDETVKNDGGTEVKVKSEWKVTPLARGFWYGFTYNQKSTKDYPGFQAVGHFGWDATDKKLVMAAFDDGGGRWSYSATPAPTTPNALSWTGEAHLGGQTVPVRYTWTLTGEKPAAATFLLELEANKEWVRLADGSCKVK